MGARITPSCGLSHGCDGAADCLPPFRMPHALSSTPERMRRQMLSPKRLSFAGRIDTSHAKARQVE